jgi:two-component system chemotaxis response regulator CheB
MPDRDVVVVGASAGGVEALVDLAASLPADLPAAVLVVLHVPPTGTSALPHILNRHGPLRAGHASDGEPIARGRIYVAPPDRHLLVRPGQVHLTLGPPENGHRPAIDPLFRSAARSYGSRVIGVVLSGTLDDGTAGMLAIKARGGLGVVQGPADARYPGMPGSAATHAKIDHVLAAASMGQLLARLTNGSAGAPGRPPDETTTEVQTEAIDG